MQTSKTTLTKEKATGNLEVFKAMLFAAVIPMIYLVGKLMIAIF